MPKKRTDKAPSLDQEYRYQASKRSSFDYRTGLPSAAAAGDRDALSKCAAAAKLALTHEDHPHRDDLIAWLQSCLFLVEIGRSPDEAFGWKRRPGRKREFQTIFKQWLIGQHMDGLVNGSEPLTIEAASLIVAKERHVSDEFARECFQNFREAGEELE